MSNQQTHLDMKASVMVAELMEESGMAYNHLVNLL